jgi:uncharacterized protein (DUF58 family)
VSSAPGHRLEARWRVTSAHIRALFLGLLLAGIGVLLRRPDALVIGAPLLVVGLWATATRPRTAPTVVARVVHPLLREGQATRWQATITPGSGVEEAGLALLPTPHTEYTPGHRTVATAFGGADQPSSLEVVCRSTRWGRRPLGPAILAVSGPFGAFRWEPQAVSLPAIPTVPLPDTFSARVPVPHPDGLVGQNRSHHQGSGGELDQIRPFRFGDRLRRVHWPVSVRTGELHVTATHADQDTEILLLVDAMHDIGQSAGV